MRYLGLALFAEGNTDHRFLSPVLRRAIEDLCLRYSDDIVEIGEVLELHSPPRYRDRDRVTRILEAAREAQGAYNLLFVHTDGAGDPGAALGARVWPAIQRITQGEDGFEVAGKAGVRLLTWGEPYLTAWLEAVRGASLTEEDYRNVDLQPTVNPVEKP